MDILPLVVEGIENKIKKLLLLNQQLQDENKKLRNTGENLEVQLRELHKRLQEQEGELTMVKVAKSLSGKDNLLARQQINELLREIEKCYALLNR